MSFATLKRCCCCSDVIFDPWFHSSAEAKGSADNQADAHNKNALRGRETAGRTVLPYYAELTSASSHSSQTFRLSAGTKQRWHLSGEPLLRKKGQRKLTQAAEQEQASHESSHRHLAVSNVTVTIALTHTGSQGKHARIHSAAPPSGERYEDGGGSSAHCWMLPSTSFHSYEGAEPPPRAGRRWALLRLCSHLPLPTVGAEPGHYTHTWRKRMTFQMLTLR